MSRIAQNSVNGRLKHSPFCSGAEVALVQCKRDINQYNWDGMIRLNRFDSCLNHLQAPFTLNRIFFNMETNLSNLTLCFH